MPEEIKLQQLLDDSNVNFSKLKSSRHTVMVVGAFSPRENSSNNHSYEHTIKPGDNRNQIYDDFVNQIQPRLAEELLENGSEIKGIKKLVVPTGSSSETFVIDRHNYFFRRAASNSKHTFFSENFTGVGKRLGSSF